MDAENVIWFFIIATFITFLKRFLIFSPRFYAYNVFNFSTFLQQDIFDWGAAMASLLYCA